MKKKPESKYRKAWDRFTEEFRPDSFLSKEEMKEAFFDWLNPEAGKYKGLSGFEDFIDQKWQEFVRTLPPEEAAWYEWTEEVAISPERLEKYKEAYEYALEAQTWRQAWGRFYGKLPYAERGTPEAYSLWQAVKRWFL